MIYENRIPGRVREQIYTSVNLKAVRLGWLSICQLMTLRKIKFGNKSPVCFFPPRRSTLDCIIMPLRQSDNFLLHLELKIRIIKTLCSVALSVVALFSWKTNVEEGNMKGILHKNLILLNGIRIPIQSVLGQNLYFHRVIFGTCLSNYFAKWTRTENIFSRTEMHK